MCVCEEGRDEGAVGRESIRVCAFAQVCACLCVNASMCVLHLRERKHLCAWRACVCVCVHDGLPPVLQ